MKSSAPTREAVSDSRSRGGRYQVEQRRSDAEGGCKSKVGIKAGVEVGVGVQKRATQGLAESQ